MNKVHAKGSAKLFNSKALEILTRTHPSVILSMYIPFCAYLLWYFYRYVQPSFTLTLILFFTGAFFWTFVEYIMHRWVFHWVGESPGIQRFHYLVHGVHHEFPKDKQRLIMPPLPSIAVAALFFIIFRLVMGQFVFAFLSGFIMGYLTYAMIHYIIHAYRPPKNAIKILWEHHNMHHYKYPDKAFGVSSPFWDHIFGTVPPKIQKMHRKSVDVEQ